MRFVNALVNVMIVRRHLLYDSLLSLVLCVAFIDELGKREVELSSSSLSFLSSRLLNDFTDLFLFDF